MGCLSAASDPCVPEAMAEHRDRCGRQVPVLAAAAETFLADAFKARQAKAEADEQLAANKRELEEAEASREAADRQREAAEEAMLDALKKLHEAEQQLATKDNEVTQARRREEDARRHLENNRSLQALHAADERQQRTLDNGVRSGFSSVEKLYRANNLKKDSAGNDIPENLYKTDFKRSVGGYGHKRGRNMLKSLHHIIDSILDTYERNPNLKDDLFKAYSLFRCCPRDSACVPSEGSGLAGHACLIATSAAILTRAMLLQGGQCIVNGGSQEGCGVQAACRPRRCGDV